MGRAGGEGAHRGAVEARDRHLGLDRAAVARVAAHVGVGVEDVDDPHVGVLVESREEVDGQARGEGEHASRGGDEVAALARRAVATGEARVDAADGRAERVHAATRTARRGRVRGGRGGARRRRGRGATASPAAETPPPRASESGRRSPAADASAAPQRQPIATPAATPSVAAASVARNGDPSLITDIQRRDVCQRGGSARRPHYRRLVR